MTDFRALCAELHAAFNTYAVDEPHHDLLVRARAALAQPEPQGPGPDDVTQLYYKHGGGDGMYGGMGEVNFEEAVEEALARWGRSAKPEPQGLTNEEIEEAAKLIHASMRFAVPDKHYTCGWVEHGNSLMQDEARRTARAVLARWGRPAIEPVPVNERPWEREGWCDADGQCWMGDAGGRGFVPSWRLCKPDDSCLAWSLPHWALPVPNSYSTTPGNQ